MYKICFSGTINNFLSDFQRKDSNMLKNQCYRVTATLLFDSS